MKLKFKVKQEEYNRKYLEVLNGFMNLTPVELDVLEQLVEIYFIYSNAGFKGDVLWSHVFGSTSRKEIQKNLNMKSRTNVDKYMLFLRNKGVIENGKLISIVIPNKDDKELTIEFKLDA